MCFCHSSNRDFFLSSLVLRQCFSTSSNFICYENHFSPIVNRLDEFFPDLIAHRHCLNKSSCLYPLETFERCFHCSFSTRFVRIEKKCFDLCQSDRTCSFLCLVDGLVINCSSCSTRQSNVTCRSVDSTKNFSKFFVFLVVLTTEKCLKFVRFCQRRRLAGCKNEVFQQPEF